jgi:hypothetical protein
LKKFEVDGVGILAWGATQKQEKRGKIGWEAWTRTRIARVRVWSPTNWTTSQPRERRRKCSGQKAPATALQPFKNKTRELAASTGRNGGIDALSCLHARNWEDLEAGKNAGKRREKRYPREENFLVWLVVFFAQGILYTAHRSFDFPEIILLAPMFATVITEYSLRKFAK